MKNRTERDKYLADRTAFAERIGQRELWSVIDHWPLYCGIGNLARFIAIQDIFRRTLSVPGHIAEFGSWRGANLLHLAKLLRIFDPHGSKLVHGFDSFTGLQSFADQDLHSTSQRGAYRGDYEELLSIINLYELQDEIVLHKGFVADTLGPLLESQQELSFSMVYLDMDLYEPTLQAMVQMHPRLSKGGVFVLDEWNMDSFPGESIAAREFLNIHGSSYSVEHIRGANQPSMLLVKETH